MELGGTNIKQSLSNKFCCEKCNYATDRKGNMATHIASAKHLKELNGTNIKQILSNLHDCKNCNKIYKTASGLWKHHQKCVVGGKIMLQPVAETDPDKLTDHDLIMMLIKENSELKNMMMKVIENGTHNTTNNTTNSHNKAFNLNFFLNETCKDAMNIMDFVDSIKLQLSDLEKVGELGYVEGISNIIVKNLNELDVTQRPVHCTDKKRETMYIRDENKWEKDESNSKIKKAIKRVASKNQRLLPKFKEAHPDCGTYHSKYSDQYNKIIIESVGGSGDNDAEKEEKIIRNISKNVVVEK